MHKKKAETRECAITGMSLGTHGKAVVVGEGYVSPEIYGSFIRVLDGVAGLNLHLRTFAGEGWFNVVDMKEVVSKMQHPEVVAKRILEKFRAHSRATSFVKNVLGLPLPQQEESLLH